MSVTTVRQFLHGKLAANQISGGCELRQNQQARVFLTVSDALCDAQN